MGRLDQRVAVITGGGEGIGKGIARRFAEEGARVVIAEINEDRGRTTADELASSTGAETLFVRTDVGRKDDNEAMIDAAVEQWGTVDILVNNAWGGGKISRVELKTDALIDHGLAIGFRGPLWAMQAAFPTMKAQGLRPRHQHLLAQRRQRAHGHARVQHRQGGAARGDPHRGARVGGHRHRAQRDLPGGEVVHLQARSWREHPELVAAADASNPMGRIGDPYEDISPVALFLASDDCRYLTGNTLFVDGGSHINGSAWAPDLPDEP